VGTDFLTQLPSGLSNQRFGWDAIEHILITISKLLQSQLDEAAMIGRLGGNQFAVSVKKTTKTSAKTTARGIVDCISGFPFKWKDHSIQIRVYIGFCSGESSARKITSKAIHASVIAKEKAVGSIVNYQDSVVNQGGRGSKTRLN
jgi:diguanylate cyclase (GGDEF)-like protein